MWDQYDFLHDSLYLHAKLPPQKIVLGGSYLENQ